MAIHTLSDYNSPYTRATRVSRPDEYRDLPLSLAIHPNTKDIVPLNDLDAIKQSVRNLVLTNFGEKPFRPMFGGKVTQYLFENPSVFTEIGLRKEIIKVLTRYEPRITDVTVQLVLDQAETSYHTTIGFKTVDGGSQEFMEFTFNRLR